MTQPIEERLAAFLEPGSVRRGTDQRSDTTATRTWVGALRTVRAAIARGDALAGNAQLIAAAHVAVGGASTNMADGRLRARFAQEREALRNELFDLEQSIRP